MTVERQRNRTKNGPKYSGTKTIPVETIEEIERVLMTPNAIL